MEKARAAALIGRRFGTHWKKYRKFAARIKWALLMNRLGLRAKKIQRQWRARKGRQAALVQRNKVAARERMRATAEMDALERALRDALAALEAHLTTKAGRRALKDEARACEKARALVEREMAEFFRARRKAEKVQAKARKKQEDAQKRLDKAAKRAGHAAPALAAAEPSSAAPGAEGAEADGAAAGAPGRGGGRRRRERDRRER